MAKRWQRLKVVQRLVPRHTTTDLPMVVLWSLAASDFVAVFAGVVSQHRELKTINFNLEMRKPNTAWSNIARNALQFKPLQHPIRMSVPVSC
eukprot:1989712-Amphidinium_carterae.2